MQKKLNRQTLINLILLAAAAFLLCWLFVFRDAPFGSKVDWISQHSVLPGYFRQRFYETKDLFPDFAANIGGGQNIYNFAYYGLFSPIILFSYLSCGFPGFSAGCANDLSLLQPAYVRELHAFPSYGIDRNRLLFS